MSTDHAAELRRLVLLIGTEGRQDSISRTLDAAAAEIERQRDALAAITQVGTGQGWQADAVAMVRIAIHALSRPEPTEPRA